jgi:hypothetical protein
MRIDPPTSPRPGLPIFLPIPTPGQPGFSSTVPVHHRREQSSSPPRLSKILDLGVFTIHTNDRALTHPATFFKELTKHLKK